MKNLLGALGTGVNTSPSALIAVCTFGILYALQIENWVGISFSVIVGLVAGIIIGQSTEYYTSHSLQTDAENRQKRRDGTCDGHHLRYRHGHDIDGHSGRHDRSSHPFSPSSARRASTSTT